MSKAADLAALIGSQSSLSNRNLIINGAMQVAQRGTSTSFAHDGTITSYTLDRFSFVMRNTADEFDCTVTQDSDAPDGFSNSLKVTTGTPESVVDADDYVFLRQRIESQNLQQLNYGASGALSATVSFYVKSSQTGTFGVNLYGVDGARITGSTYTINSANTWEYKTITFAGDASGTINNDNDAGLQLTWHLAAGSDWASTDNTSWVAYSDAAWAYGHAQNGVVTTASATWQITGVQLEVGEQDTPFEHRSYGDELARCQRYYYNTYPTPQSSGSAGLGVIAPTLNAGDRYAVSVSFPVEMRTDPTIVYYGGRSGSADTADRVSIYNNDTLRSFTSEPNQTPKMISGNFDTNNVDDAVSFHFTADAEL